MPYMRITWGKIHPGNWDHFLAAYTQVADPDIEGMQARWLVRSVDDPDAIFAITLWDSREAIENWERSKQYQTEFHDRISAFMAGSYSVSISEVAYSSLHGEKLLAGGPVAGPSGR